jgi:hypothetical protein
MICRLSEPTESIVGRLYGPAEARGGDHEAVRVIEGDPARSPLRPMSPVTRPLEERPEGWQDFARGVVAKAEAMLWSDRGQESRDDLARRGLSRETILGARLGFWPVDEWFANIYPDRRILVPSGIVIPWFDGADVTRINVRRAGRGPESFTVLGSHRGGLFPRREGIVTGSTLLIAGGEFDALLLNQELGDLAPVVTLGNAGDRPSARVKSAMLGASPWIVADNADAADEKSAQGWLARSDRCIQGGLDLLHFWREVLNRHIGRSSRTEDPPEPTSTSEGTTDGPFLLDRTPEPAPTSCPWRESVARWPDDWRLRWGYLTNTYCHQGMTNQEAEEMATAEVTAEREAADFASPPLADPDPWTALWRDFLDEMIASGDAQRLLSPSELREAQALPTAMPLDGEAIRSVVHRVIAQGRVARHQALGIPEPTDESRWRCHNPFCLDKGRWWMSVHRVVNCKNCRAPSFPWLIQEEGDAEDAPHVEPGRSTHALKPRSRISPTPSTRRSYLTLTR